MSKKTASSGGFSITQFLVKKRRDPEPKDETTTRNKIQTASNSKINNDYIRTCQKVEKWKHDFYFWKTLDSRPTNDSSKRVTWIPDGPENEIVTCCVCKKYPSECDQHNQVTKGTKIYQNYMNRHGTELNNKHQKYIEIYLRE